jgi:hypothetical protein
MIITLDMELDQIFLMNPFEANTSWLVMLV